MGSFDWKSWGKGLLAAITGAAVNSVVTTTALTLTGTPVGLKTIGVAAGGAALTTVVAYLKQSPLGVSQVAFDPTKK
ncbi:MAG TPA: hypothetical protein VFS27_06240 [Blastocatellia bacterium]|jgi:hypothetical protein|nr:hypothetical protein [Blastocatellia bacterium]